MDKITALVNFRLLLTFKIIHRSLTCIFMNVKTHVCKTQQIFCLQKADIRKRCTHNTYGTVIVQKSVNTHLLNLI